MTFSNLAVHFGGELTNVTDLICSLIRSGVTANSLEAFDGSATSGTLHLVSEPILLPSLLNAAAERMNSNGKNTISCFESNRHK